MTIVTKFGRPFVGFAVGVAVSGLALLTIQSAYSSDGSTEPAGIDLDTDRLAISGPDGSPLVDKCGDEIGVTAEEIFAAMDDRPAELDPATFDIEADAAMRSAQTAAVSRVIEALDLAKAGDLGPLTDESHPLNEKAESMYYDYLAEEYSNRKIDLPARPAPQTVVEASEDDVRETTDAVFAAIVAEHNAFSNC